MAVLSTKDRNKIKDSEFGLIEKVKDKRSGKIKEARKYPMNDKSHAANAKARATQQVKKGNLSSGEKEKIDAKANKILYGSNEIKPKSDNHNSKSSKKRLSSYDNVMNYVREKR